MAPSKEHSASPKSRREGGGHRFGPSNGSIFHDIRVKLTAAGLRPTRQRMALGYLLFTKGDRHVTAEMLEEEALASRVSISLATIYNSLHQFTLAGLLREVTIDGSRTYFDTNTSAHHHFMVEGSNVLIDIPSIAVDRQAIPPLPPGKRIASVDVIVRLCDDPSA